MTHNGICNIFFLLIAYVKDKSFFWFSSRQNIVECKDNDEDENCRKHKYVHPKSVVIYILSIHHEFQSRSSYNIWVGSKNRI